MWITAVDGSQPTARSEVEVELGSAPIVIRYGPTPVGDDLPPGPSPAAADVGQRAMTAGKVAMISGGALMAVGVGVFFGGVFATNDLSESISLVGAGAIVGLIGAPTLLAGGVSYGVGKAALAGPGSSGA